MDTMSEEKTDVGDAQARLAEALANAQADIGGAKKGSQNQHFRSKYADLKSVWDAWQEVGPANGLCVVQQVLDAGSERQGILLRTVLMHKDGGMLDSESFWPAVKNDPQAYGSALTYARRYTLAALVGICPEDDDGNAASKAVQSADLERFEAAVAKYSTDKAKLEKILEEAQKAGLSEIVTKVKKLIGGL